MPRTRHTVNIWPGFVDALATLLLVIVFVLVAVVLAQFPLAALSSAQSADLDALRARVADLQTALATARGQNGARHQDHERLHLELQQTRERLQRFARLLEDYRARLEENRAELVGRDQQLDAQRLRLREGQRALRSLRDEHDRLRLTLAGSQADLRLGEDRVSTQAAEIQRLRAQLVAAREAGREPQQRQQLAGYRSIFLERLYQALGNHPDVKIIGERFLLQSEILFASGSARLGAAGRRELASLAGELKAIVADLPANLDWVLQVGGHTDRRPIRTREFPSNWELSSARALAVVRFLIDAGLPAGRLAATGYGEFHPLNPADDPAAWRENRRIELKFTSR